MEENFEEMWEQFCNEEEMQEKYDMDEEEEKRQRQEISAATTESIFSKDDCISIQSFACEYLDIIAEKVPFYHSGLIESEAKEKGDASYCFSILNNYANKNPELVRSGLLLLVIDARGNRATYINPLYIRKYLDEEELQKEEKEFLSKEVHDLRELNDLYEEYINIKGRIDGQKRDFYKVLKENGKREKFKRLKDAQNSVIEGKERGRR